MKCLLCNHTQNFDINAVELVEASPGACLSEAAEKSGHHLNSKPLNREISKNCCFSRLHQDLGTIKHDNLVG